MPRSTFNMFVFIQAFVPVFDGLLLFFDGFLSWSIL